MVPFWTTLTLGAILHYFISSFLSRRKLPPGPTPWPIIGNLGRELKPPFIIHGLEEMAGKFGMCTVHMPFPVINITDYETIKEALQGDDLSGRYKNSVTDLFTNEVSNGGIITSDGPFWREQRRLAITVLRDLGMGRNVMEEKIQLSLRDYITYLKEHPHLDAIDMHFPIHVLVANIINEFIFGIRYKYKTADPLKAYLREMESAIQEFGQSKMFLATVRFPIIRKIPILRWFGYDRYKARADKMIEYIRDHAEIARKTFDLEEEPTNCVQAYLKRARDDPSMTDRQLVACCSDLFNAGQETTITTSKWGIIFMAEVQERIREEIRAVTADGRMPSYADKLVERTIRFGLGKRQCAGEGLARMELFLGLTTTVQNFRILPPIGGKVDTEPVYTGAVHPSKPHNLQLEPIKLEY